MRSEQHSIEKGPVTFVWMRTCPWCAKAIEKAYPETGWVCACSWTGQDRSDDEPEPIYSYMGSSII